MIRVELGREIDRHGIFEYSFQNKRGEVVQRRSRQPLLDACRELKRMGEATEQRVGLFREGRSKPDATCSVEWGAEHTVLENRTDGPRFVKYKPYPK